MNESPIRTGLGKQPGAGNFACGKVPRNALSRGTAYLNGPGTETSDSIPANLSKGEAVLPAKTVSKVGVKNIAKLIQQTNDGKAPAGGKLKAGAKFSGGYLDDQAKSDAETASNVWNAAKGLSQRTGAAIMDAATAVPRAASQAYDTVAIRPLRAAGVNADYLAPKLVPDGASTSSLTPFSDVQSAKLNAANTSKPVPASPTLTTPPVAIPKVEPAFISTTATPATAPLPTTLAGGGRGGPIRTLDNESNEDKAAAIARMSVALLGGYGLPTGPASALTAQTSPIATGVQKSAGNGMDEWLLKHPGATIQEENEALTSRLSGDPQKAPTLPAGPVNNSHYTGVPGMYAANAQDFNTLWGQSRAGQIQQGGLKAGLSPAELAEQHRLALTGDTNAISQGHLGLAKGQFDLAQQEHSMKMTQANQLQSLFNAWQSEKNPEKKAVLEYDYRIASGKPDSSRATVVPGTPYPDPNNPGMLLKTPNQLFDNRTQKFIEAPSDQQTRNKIPHPDAIVMLKNNPNLAAEFDAQYGEGAAKQVLGK